MAAFDELKDLLGNKRVEKSLAAKYMSATELKLVGKYLSTNQLVGTENFSNRELKDVAESIDGTFLDYRTAISRHINRVAVLASNLTKEAHQAFEKKLDLLGSGKSKGQRTLRRRKVTSLFYELVADFSTANLEATNLYLNLANDLSEANVKVQRLKGLNVKSNKSLEKLYNLAELVKDVQKDQSEYEKLFTTSSQFEKCVKQMGANISSEKEWNKHYLRALNQLCQLFADLVACFGIYLDIQRADTRKYNIERTGAFMPLVNQRAQQVKDFGKRMDELMDRFRVKVADDIFSMRFHLYSPANRGDVEVKAGLIYTGGVPPTGLTTDDMSDSTIMEDMEKHWTEAGPKIEALLSEGIQDHPDP